MIPLGNAARLLAGVVALATIFGALLADFLIPAGAAQHLRNDAWPPHAKFHDAQYIVMSLLLGVIALVLLMRRGGDRFPALGWACAVLAVPWLALLGALLFPGTAIQDPEFDNPSALGLHPQILLSLILLALLLAAVALAARQRPGAAAEPRRADSDRGEFGA
ncbi:DUF6640 family protein [Nocardia sp. NPDC023988]|uniref:DUF6640 family protein n=1 Tax=unclassified Nocardia TaxID=2637762 RepID=UPI0034109364